MSELFKDLIFKYLDLAEMSELFKDVIFKYLDLAEMSERFKDSESRAQDLSNDVSFVIFGHQTWDCLVFKYPSRDRVKHFKYPDF